MLPVIMAAGRALASGGSKAMASAKNFIGMGGPRGANELLEGGAAAAGKASPLDIMGNVANIAGVGMQGYDMFKGGDKPKDPATGTSHYESALD